ncbi:MAG TPA: hypothetical protein VLK59_07110 [Solirubrobacteraceae bacterium]|nr:hypothetical protein [Solirubrobacteraceae bacterium]
MQSAPEVNVERRRRMWDWATIVVLYLFAVGFFYLLGGLSSAADALEGWGRRSASTCKDHLP